MTKPKIVLTHRVHDEVLSYLEEYCHPFPNQTGRTLPREEVIERTRDAHGMMVFMPDLIDTEFLDACPDLRVIGAALKGYDNFLMSVPVPKGVSGSL